MKRGVVALLVVMFGSSSMETNAMHGGHHRECSWCVAQAVCNKVTDAEVAETEHTISHDFGARPLKRDLLFDVAKKRVSNKQFKDALNDEKAVDKFRYEFTSFITLRSFDLLLEKAKPRTSTK